MKQINNNPVYFLYIFSLNVTLLLFYSINNRTAINRIKNYFIELPIHLLSQNMQNKFEQSNFNVPFNCTIHLSRHCRIDTVHVFHYVPLTFSIQFNILKTLFLALSCAHCAQQPPFHAITALEMAANHCVAFTQQISSAHTHHQAAATTAAASKRTRNDLSSAASVNDIGKGR